MIKIFSYFELRRADGLQRNLLHSREFIKVCRNVKNVTTFLVYIFAIQITMLLLKRLCDYVLMAKSCQFNHVNFNLIIDERNCD